MEEGSGGEITRKRKEGTFIRAWVFEINFEIKFFFAGGSVYFPAGL